MLHPVTGIEDQSCVCVLSRASKAGDGILHTALVQVALENDVKVDPLERCGQILGVV